MTSAFFEQAINLIEQLEPDERLMLMQHLRQMPPFISEEITRESLLAEHATLKTAGAFEHEISLFGAYPEPRIEVSEEEIHQYLREISHAWEQELNDLLNS